MNLLNFSFPSISFNSILHVLLLRSCIDMTRINTIPMDTITRMIALQTFWKRAIETFPGIDMRRHNLFFAVSFYIKRPIAFIVQGAFPWPAFFWASHIDLFPKTSFFRTCPRLSGTVQRAIACMVSRQSRKKHCKCLSTMQTAAFYGGGLHALILARLRTIFPIPFAYRIGLHQKARAADQTATFDAGLLRRMCAGYRTIFHASCLYMTLVRFKRCAAVQAYACDARNTTSLHTTGHRAELGSCLTAFERLTTDSTDKVTQLMHRTPSIGVWEKLPGCSCDGGTSTYEAAQPTRPLKYSLLALLLLLLPPALWSATSLSMTWDPPTMNTDGTPLTDLAMTYVYRQTTSEVTWHLYSAVAAPDATFTDPAPALGVNCYQVTAVNAEGRESAPSNALCFPVPAPPQNLR